MQTGYMNKVCFTNLNIYTVLDCDCCITTNPECQIKYNKNRNLVIEFNTEIKINLG